MPCRVITELIYHPRQPSVGRCRLAVVVRSTYTAMYICACPIVCLNSCQSPPKDRRLARDFLFALHLGAWASSGRPLAVVYAVYGLRSVDWAVYSLWSVGGTQSTVYGPVRVASPQSTVCRGATGVQAGASGGACTNAQCFLKACSVRKVALYRSNNKGTIDTLCSCPRQQVGTINPRHERCKNAAGRSFRGHRALQCRSVRPCRPATGPLAVPVQF